MKAPPDTAFHEDSSLFVWTPRGVVTEAIVNQIIAYIGDMEAHRKRPFNRFTDSQGAAAIELNFRYIFHVSLYRRLSYHGPPIQSAVLVTDATKDPYAKMHALLTQGSPIKVRIFEEREAAAQWLGVPIAVLKAPNPPA
jgi:hypothetical protein